MLGFLNPYKIIYTLVSKHCLIFSSGKANTLLGKAGTSIKGA